MRNIRVSFPSGTVKMVLWEGTEDEKAFPVKSLNSSDHCSSYITSASYKTKSGTYYAWGRTHVWNGEKYVLQTTLNSPNQNF